MNDIEIANSVELDKIENIAKKIDISEEELECYGKYKAKINYSVYEKKKDDKDGKLILVTAINPIRRRENYNCNWFSRWIAGNWKKINSTS